MITIKEQMDLSGKVSLVTGGGGHLGETIAETLAELGSDLLLLDIHQENLEKVALKIKNNFSVTVKLLAVDLEKADIAHTVLEILEKEFGRLNVLINNAAFVGTSDLKGWATNFQHQDVNVWRRALEVNLTAPFLLTQVCADLLKKSGKGSVINIGSIHGVIGPELSLYQNTHMGSPAAYAASKGGLIQLTRWLSTVLAPEVRVNAISPGGIWRNQPDNFCERYLNKTPLGRMAQESDLKGAIAYFASDLSSYVTGQNLLVDGGYTVW